MQSKVLCLAMHGVRTLALLLIYGLSSCATDASTSDGALDALPPSLDAGASGGLDGGADNGTTSGAATGETSGGTTGASSGGNASSGGQTTSGGDDDAGAEDADSGAPPAGGIKHPFGSHPGYTSDGVIFPSVASRDELDRQVSAFYDQWKSAYVVPGCAAGQVRVHSEPATTAYTVSEAHGYGMLFTVVMAGHDPDARTVFDGLFAYFRAHPSGDNPSLMAWAQDVACKDVLGTGSATDGDLDIAFALLMAHEQWGSTGTVDYASEARKVIAGLLSSAVSAQNHVRVGSWAGNDPHADGTRSSDFIPTYYKAFARASGEARWSSVVSKYYAIVERIQTGPASNTGLLPDFIVKADTDAAQPAPVKWLEGDHDGDYHYNACRVPWRLALDYLLGGDEKARAAVRKINTFMRQKTGDDAAQVRDGYTLAGEAYGGADRLAFQAPLAVSAMIEAAASASNQRWLDALWTRVASTSSQGYYNDSIKLATMLVVSGNFWSP